MAAADTQAWERLIELIWGCAISQAIHAAVTLDIPKRLAHGPASVSQLAIDTGADRFTLTTILRALAAFEVVDVETEDCYSLTVMGRLLLPDANPSCAQDAGPLFETIYRPLGSLLEMTRTGTVAFDTAYGESFYRRLDNDSALSMQFYRIMADNVSHRYAGLSDMLASDAPTHVVDLGGGDGSLVIDLLSRNPSMTGVVVERPEAAARARANVDAAGLSDRCEVMDGDICKGVPGGGDVYLLANVLNNLGDLAAGEVLHGCRAAMTADAQLLILEELFSTAMPRWRALLSLGVLAQRGGRSRSDTEHRALLAQSGLELIEIGKLPSRTSTVISARVMLSCQPTSGSDPSAN